MKKVDNRFMKLGNKIKHIRKTRKKMKLVDLHKKIVEHYKENAISYRSLGRIEKNQLDGRLTSLSQIAYGLDMELKDLITGTHHEDDRQKDKVFGKFLPKKMRFYGKYIYNEKAYIESLSPPETSFMTVELVLSTGGKTTTEEYGKNTEILFVCTKGKIRVTIKTETYIVTRGDSLTFKGDLPHHFQNLSDKTSKAFIVQNPKSF